MHLFLKYTLSLLFLGLGACSKPVDLDAPCPEYGRYCSQAPINAWNNKEYSESTRRAL